MSHREILLRSLLRYDRPPDDVLDQLEALDVDGSEEGEEEDEAGELEEVTFTPDDAISVLHRFLEEEVSADDLLEWSEAILAHESIVLEPDHDELLSRFLDEAGDLTLESAEDWLGRFESDA